jgi:5-formyltetrahydrofolate cyclo-ligase
MVSKNTLREKLKLQRERLSKREVREQSKLIFENLLLLPEFFRADIVHTYISAKNNEVDTHEMIRLLFKKKKRVVVPIADKETKQLRHSEIFSLSELIVGSFGIPEPRMYRPIAVGDLQVVIVPALAVDRNGNRIGFGAGFYDRFLHDVQLPTIVPVYNFQVVNAVPHESTDIPVSFIVTETEIIRCRN